MKNCTQSVSHASVIANESLRDRPFEIETIIGGTFFLSLFSVLFLARFFLGQIESLLRSVFVGRFKLKGFKISRKSIHKILGI